jgi:hypothetical protein
MMSVLKKSGGAFSNSLSLSWFLQSSAEIAPLFEPPPSRLRISRKRARSKTKKLARKSIAAATPFLFSEIIAVLLPVAPQL